MTIRLSRNVTKHFPFPVEGLTHSADGKSYKYISGKWTINEKLDILQQLPSNPSEGMEYVLGGTTYKYVSNKWVDCGVINKTYDMDFKKSKKLRTQLSDLNLDNPTSHHEQITEAVDEEIMTKLMSLAPKQRLGANGSRFRKRYRELTPGELAWHDAIKDTAAKLEALLEPLLLTEYRSLALLLLEASVMFSVKELTGNTQAHPDEHIMKFINRAKRANAN